MFGDGAPYGTVPLVPSGKVHVDEPDLVYAVVVVVPDPFDTPAASAQVISTVPIWVPWAGEVMSRSISCRIAKSSTARLPGTPAASPI